MKSVRDHDFLAATDPAPTTSNTKFTRAWQIIKADAVSFSSRLGVYTVQGYNGVHSVKLNPLSCSCGLKGDQCVHKLSVLLANRFDVQADEAYEEINLNALSKKGKGKGKKSGRKNPRRCDVDAIAAPDSAAAKQIPSESDPPPVKKIRPQTQTPESETPSKDPSPSSIPSSSLYWINPCKLTRNIALLFDDRDYIGQHKWICDRIIDASQAIIKHQYKVKGLQSTLFAATPDHFAKQTGEWYQIINTTPTSGGSHWILLSTKNHAQNKHEFIPVIDIHIPQLRCNNTNRHHISSHRLNHART